MPPPALAAQLASLCMAAVAAGVPGELEPGLTVRLYDVGRPMDRLHPLGPDQTPNVDRRHDRIEFHDEAALGGPLDHFVVEAFGYLDVAAPGSYEFELVSDDGARLWIDASLVIDHDGLHGPAPRRGTVELEPGLHPFRIRMFENDGGAALVLRWRPPGAVTMATVPATAFRIEKGVTRVVSPGRKVLLDGKEDLRPGDGLPLEGVHPAWRVEDIRPEGFEPQVGGMAFLPDGRLVLSSFEPVNNGVFRERPNGTIWVLENVIDGDPETIVARQIADGFHDPAGVAVVDGDVFVAHRTDITRLADVDGDGRFESRRILASGWVSDNYHHFTFGLVAHDGWLYGSLSTSIYFENTMRADDVEGTVVSMNGPNPAHRGTCFRVAIESGRIEYLAGGFRTPNGLGLGPGGELLVADNQGAWLPSSKLINARAGRFYGHYNGAADQRSARYPEGGHPSLHADRPVSPPAVWLPQNECANSPTESLLIRVGPFAGQVYLGELTMGGIRRVFLESIDGEWQGAVFRFTQGLECGVNRLIEGPDGCLYVGGTGADGNWSWRGTRFGLQRLRRVGGTVLEYETIRVLPEGFDVRFTRPVLRAWLADPASYAVTQWRYEPTPEYGGPKQDVRRLEILEASPSDDGRSVRLTIEGLRPGHVVHLRADPTGAGGEPMWSTDAWYTLNRIPSGG